MKGAAALKGARDGAITGALIGSCALALSALLISLSPEFRSERPELSVLALAIMFLGGGTVAGAAAGAIRVFWAGRLGKIAISVILTAAGYFATYPLMNRTPFIPDGEHFFGLVFTSLIVGTLIGLTSTDGNKSD